ncbi:hypothetical protein N8T08_010717 [Aspergillus melleus]|uniref:Uncharacterized protein n=1 Tax=Aspergillus melleus TaxID=138277 RepID=A0ACC3BC76_9EURO|nr:hypothetical protein N8T08_010717 [Aspergillus melleus]
MASESADIDKPKVDVLTSSRIYPRTKHDEVTVPLSVVDAMVMHYGPSSAVWFFEDAGKDDIEKVIAQLKESLQVTLSVFPHLAGHLKMVKHNPEGDHTQRYARLEITYGATTDPGVQFDTAKCDLKLDDIIPSHKMRQDPAYRAWGSSSAYPAFFLPDMSKLPFFRNAPEGPTPAALVQVTQFACGAVAIGMMFTHPMADAHTLAMVAHRWSYDHTVLFCDKSSTLSETVVSPPPNPLYDPQMLDRCAPGDIDGTTPDPAILEKSRSLPSLRHDNLWPAEGDDPDRFLPPGLTRDMITSPGVKPPMQDWDFNAPVSHVKLHFTSAETERIWQAAGKGVSRHDAILAHVWRAVNRARGWSDDDRNVSLHVIFGLRKRLGLPTTFMGSPILSTTITTTGKEGSGGLALGDVARKINNTLALYTKEALQTRIYDLCFECAPQRFWEGFLGARNMIFTSWAHLNLYAVDFGGRWGKARLVDIKMPDLDGMIWLTEGRPALEKDSAGERHWCDDGVDVSMNIGREAAGRLKADSTLWEW